MKAAVHMYTAGSTSLEEGNSESASQNFLSNENIQNIASLLHAGSSVISPAIPVLISAFKLIAMCREQEKRPPDRIDMLDSNLRILDKNIAEGFKGLHEHLEHFNQNVAMKFARVVEYIQISQTTLEYRLKILGEAPYEANNYQTASNKFAAIRGDKATFLKQSDRGKFYLEYMNPKFAGNLQQLSPLLTSFNTEVDSLKENDNNGRWLEVDNQSEIPPLKQLIISAKSPEYTTGYIAKKLSIENVPSFYQYEHYTHMFSRLASMMIQRNNLSIVYKEKIFNIARKLILKGEALKELFSKETLETTLANYFNHREALISALIAKEKTLDDCRASFLTSKREAWIEDEENALVTYYAPSKIQVSGSYKFSYLERLYEDSQLKIKDVKRIANPDTYEDLLPIEKRTPLRAAQRIFDYLEYLLDPEDTKEYDAKEEAYYKNRSLASQRKKDLKRVSEEVSKLKEKSLIELLFDKEHPKIAPHQRGYIQGNFLEIAYQTNASWERVVMFCNHSTDDFKHINPLHKKMILPAIGKSNEKDLQTKDYLSQFLVSIIHTTKIQNNRGLRGRTFIVLSELVNMTFLKELVFLRPYLHKAHLKQLMPPEVEGFNVRGKEYKKVFTYPDGACALHALLGKLKVIQTVLRSSEEENKPQEAYYKEKARDAFKTRLHLKMEQYHQFTNQSPDTLSPSPAMLDHVIGIKDLLQEILKEHLDCAIAKNGEDRSSRMLFPQSKATFLISVPNPSYDKWEWMSHEDVEQLKKTKRTEVFIDDVYLSDFDDPEVDEVIEVEENGSIKRFSRPKEKSLRIEIPLAEEEPIEDERPSTPDSAYGDGSIYRGVVCPASPSKSQDEIAAKEKSLILQSPEGDNEFDWIPHVLSPQNGENEEKVPSFQRKRKEEERIWIKEGTLRREDLERLRVPKEFWEILGLPKERVVGIKIAECWKLLKAAHKKALNSLKDEEAKLWASHLKTNQSLAKQILKQILKQLENQKVVKTSKKTTSVESIRPSSQISSHERLRTSGDGNCLIHALFGKEKDRDGQIIHSSSKEYREEISKEIETLAEKNPNGIPLKSYWQTTGLEEQIESPNALKALAKTMSKNLQYLGLEHAHLIAKIKKINILVIHEITGEKVELFCKEGSKEADHVIAYNGCNHWSQCRKISKPPLEVPPIKKPEKEDPSPFGKPQGEALKILHAYPKKLLDIVNTDRETFLKLIVEEEAQNTLRACKESQRNLISKQDVQLDEFALSKEVYKQYLSTIMGEDFWFNTDEIHLAALLFDKKVQIVSKRGEDTIPVTELINPLLPSSTIIICHKGNHFSRCIPAAALDYAKTLRMSRNAEDRNAYRKSLKELIKNYKEFLENPIKKAAGYNEDTFKPDEVPNPFLKDEDLVENSKVLLPLNGKDLIPLAFPQALMQAIEDSLLLSDIDGIPVPYYNFCLSSEEAYYELSIEYRVFRTQEDPTPQDYCRFIVAEMGRDSVEAFYHKNSENEKIFQNEFLIQAMYTHLDKDLGIPGNGTFRIIQTEIETVVPIKTSFKGLFQIFQETPTQKVLVNRDFEPIGNALMPPKKKLKCFPKNDHNAIQNALFLKRAKTLDHLKKGLQEYIKAKEAYFLVEALLNITTTKDNTLVSTLNLFKKVLPDPDEILHNPYFRKKKTENDKEKEAQTIDSVCTAIKAGHSAYPSIERQNLESHLRTLKYVLSEIPAREEEKGAVSSRAFPSKDLATLLENHCSEYGDVG